MTTPRILVVEDDLIVAQSIKNHLTNLGYNVAGMINQGQTAIEEVGALQPDLVLMDIKLPGKIDGITAAGEIHARYNTPVVYLTAYADDEILARAKMTEPFGYILKPFGVKELHSTIETALYKHQAEQALRRAYQDWETFFQAVSHPVIILDPQQCILRANHRALEVVNKPEDEVIGQKCYQFFYQPGTKSAPDDCPFEELCRSGRSETVEMEMEALGGTFLVSCTPVMDQAGQLEKVIHIATDISQRKQAEQALAKVNQALHLLSDCNQALIRAKDETDLLNKICRITVEEGGYRLAWVGFAQYDSIQSVQPVAWAGVKADYFEALQIGWGDNEYGGSPTGQAIRTGQPAICANAHTDLSCAPWRAIAQKYGYASSIALPLIDNEQTLGVLNIYAAAPNAFDQQEVELLRELADDVAYGIITLRLRAEHQRSESTLRSIFRAAPIGIGLVVNRVLLQVNDLFCKMTGYSREELIGQSSRLVYPSDEEFEYVGREKYRQIGEHDVGTVETRFQCKDGTIIDILLSSAPLNPQDLSAGVMFTALDITERKHTQEALVHERTLLRTLIDLLPYPIYAKDAQARKTLANQADLFNMDVPNEAAALGKTDFDIYPPNLATKFYADDQTVIETGQPIINREEVIVVQGQPHWHLTTKVPLRDQDGQVIGLVGVGHDISERKQMEDALRASEQRYKRLLDSVTDYIYAVQLEHGRPVSTSHGPGCQAVTGYTPEEYIADPYLWYQMIYEDDRQAVTDQADRVAAGEFVLPLEHRIIHKDGSVRWVRNTPVPRHNENGELVAYDGLISDITERKLAEEEKEKLQAELVQAHKMEAIGRLTGGIAHDFNNMLTAINGFAELAKHRLPPDNPLQEMLGYILDSGNRAANLVRQLLAFSRKQIIEPKILNLNTLIIDFNKILQAIIGEDIKIETVLTPNLWPVKMDPAQVEQIIINLAANARDAMPDGGKLVIKTDNVILDQTYTASHPDTPPGQYVLLSVIDTGVGISAGLLPHIFEPFFTTKQVDKGTGLGLATVYGIVKQNQGDIQVESKEGQGTTFKIYLPCAEAMAQPMPTLASNLVMPVGHETILLVEDEAEVRHLARQVLTGQGYKVLESANGQEALQVVSSYTDPIHLLLTDVVMPGLNGKALAEQLARTRPNLKIIYISGYIDEAIAHHGVLEPGIILLQKPFSPTELARKVRDVLDTLAP